MKAFGKLLVILLTLAVVTYRPVLLFRPLVGHPMLIYQAFSHCLVGGLFGGWFASGSRWMKYSAIGASAVEIICAVLMVLMKRGVL